MGLKNRYFLVARSRRDNHFEIVPVTMDYGSSLEQIDLYTICFCGENELANFLTQAKVIRDKDSDLFIVHQTKSGGKRYLHTQEVLYSDSGQIREVAKASYAGKMDSKKREVEAIYNQFCSCMKKDQKFYEKVLYGHTNFYSKFLRYFSDRRFLDSYQIKYKDGAWMLTSYPTVRTVLETFHFYRDPSKRDFFSKKDFSRKSLEERLLVVTDRDYNPNQISLFDEESSFEKLLIEQGLLEDEKEGVVCGQKCKKREGN